MVRALTRHKRHLQRSAASLLQRQLCLAYLLCCSDFMHFYLLISANTVLSIVYNSSLFKVGLW